MPEPAPVKRTQKDKRQESMKNSARITSPQTGFTLISVSIILTVVGLLLAASMALNQVLQKAESIERTNTDITTITNRMAHFLSEHQRLPCPARTDKDVTDSGYGLETDCSDISIGTDDGNDTNDCGDGYCVAFTSVGDRIRIGIIPFRSLGIETEDAKDEHNGLYSYAVTEVQASSASTYTRGGGKVIITGTDINGDPVNMNDADFALISHGADKKGAFTATGQSSGITCTDPGLDNENCDNDAEFYVQDLFQAPGADHYDDRVEYNLLDWIYIWDNSFTENSDIYSRAFGNMGIGTDDPQQRLHVADGDMLIEDTDTTDPDEYGKVFTTRYCDDTGTKCFDPSALSGSYADGEGVRCGGEGEYMDGFETDAADPQGVRAVCAKYDQVRDVSCPARSYITGFQYDQASGTFSFTCTNAITNGSSSH